MTWKQVCRLSLLSYHRCDMLEIGSNKKSILVKICDLETSRQVTKKLHEPCRLSPLLRCEAHLPPFSLFFSWMLIRYVWREGQKEPSEAGVRQPIWGFDIRESFQKREKKKNRHCSDRKKAPSFIRLFL